MYHLSLYPLADVKTELEHMQMCFYYESKHRDNKIAAAVVPVFWLFQEALTILWCGVKSHEWVDNDIGDPENGPNPCVECARCGKIA